jgi:hypothetical protein
MPETHHIVSRSGTTCTSFLRCQAGNLAASSDLQESSPRNGCQEQPESLQNPETLNRNTASKPSPMSLVLKDRKLRNPGKKPRFTLIMGDASRARRATRNPSRNPQTLNRNTASKPSPMSLILTGRKLRNPGKLHFTLMMGDTSRVRRGTRNPSRNPQTLNRNASQQTLPDVLDSKGPKTAESRQIAFHPYDG